MRPDQYNAGAANGIAALQQAAPQSPTFEDLTGSIASNLSTAEAILSSLRSRLIGSVPTPSNLCAEKPVSEPTIEQWLHGFAERTFALHQELGAILARVTG